MNSPYLTEVQWDIPDLPFVRNKDCLYEREREREREKEREKERE